MIRKVLIEYFILTSMSNTPSYYSKLKVNTAIIMKLSMLCQWIVQCGLQ